MFDWDSMKNKIILADNKDIMKDIPDKYFDLAIVDPPYGLGDTLTIGGTWSVKYQQKGAEWDKKPDFKYFNELRRISKNQIIWGGNYFTEFIPSARCFITWVKPNMIGMHTMSDCELALTSFDKNSKIINLSSQSKESRIHVTQKPIALYRWLLQNYAKPNDKIIDTHSGSGSLACACHLEGFDFLAIEKDEDYYKASCDRLEILRSQGTLF